MEVELGGSVITALLDTGSQISLIRESVYTRHFGEKALRPLTCLKITAANGLEIPYSGYFETDLVVGGTRLENRGVLVQKETDSCPKDDLILGMNVLRDLPADIFTQTPFIYTKAISLECLIFSHL